MNQQPDTTTAAARELARELRMFPPMLQDMTPYDSATTRGVIVQFVQRNGDAIAATLDALADDNAKFRESLDAMTEYATGYLSLYREQFNDTSYELRCTADIEAAREILKHTHSVP